MSGNAARRTIVRASVVLAVVATAASCEEEPPPPRVRQVEQAGQNDDQQPVVGGACTYEPFEFRAVVDSSLSDGTLLVRPQDVVPIGGRCHLLRDAGDGRWRVLAQDGRIQASSGDSITVSGQVITLGTCTPCALGYEPD